MADWERHRQILVKAVACVVLLVLKHLRLNHVYQFEHVADKLVASNAIVLILKILNTDMEAYVQGGADLPDCHLFAYLARFRLDASRSSAESTSVCDAHPCVQIRWVRHRRSPP